MSKPKLFIGSSNESLPLAEAVQEALEPVANCVLWNKKDVFPIGFSALEALMRIIGDYDFAVFIFAAEDKVNIRAKDFKTTRDNVIFEFGLFLGKMGRHRVFAIAPMGSPDFHILTDLLGITLGKYDTKEKDLSDAVKAACRQIKRIIEAPSVYYKEQTLLEQIAAGVRSLEQIAGTRYLGQFPEFFQTHIIPCIQSSTKDFYIACDFPTYGFFSALPVHLAYKELLLTKKSKGIAIHVLFLGQERRREVTHLQMPNTQDGWDQAMKNPLFAERVRAFSWEIKQPINAPEELEKTLEASHDFGVRDFRENIANSCTEVDSPMPIYLWIADGKKAIFSIPHFGDVPTEHGFETTNRDLVESLRLLWDRYKTIPAKNP